MPIGPNDFYTIFRLEGRDAAAAYTLRPDQRSQGVPPHWMLYMMVTSADDAAKRAVEVGGTVIVQPFDVFDAGRMAVLQDPRERCLLCGSQRGARAPALRKSMALYAGPI